jgi:hypothetical protein
MRRLRPGLEREHARILRQDPAKLFNLEPSRAKAKPGDLVADNSDPVFVTVVSQVYRPPQESSSSIPPCAVCRGFPEAMRFSHQMGGAGTTTTMFEIATPAHKLHQQLALETARQRISSGGEEGFPGCGIERFTCISRWRPPDG